MNQIATIDQSSLASLADRLGASNTRPQNNSAQSNSPTIRMEQNAMIGKGRDAEKNPFFGCFFLKTDDPEEWVYGETMKIRPLSNHFNYTHMDFSKPAGEKCINRTVQISNWKQQLPDERGGYRCGRPTTKEMMDWTKEEKDKFKDITCNRIIRCLATYEGKRKTGEHVSVVNKPAIIFQAKNHFKDFEDQVIKKIPFKAKIWDYEVELVPNFGTGTAGNQYANFSYKPIMKRLEMTEEVHESLNAIIEIVADQNSKIEESFAKAVRARQVDEAALDAMSDAAMEDYDGDSAH